MSKKETKTEKEISNSFLFLGEQLDKNDIEDMIFSEEVKSLQSELCYEEVIIRFRNHLLLRIFRGSPTLMDYHYTLIPLKNVKSHELINRDVYPKPYLTVEKAGIKLYE